MDRVAHRPLTLASQGHEGVVDVITPQPPAAGIHLPRPRVSALLFGGLSRRLTVLLAPAGYGKTTALRSFVRETGLPAVWLEAPAQLGWRQCLHHLAQGIVRQLGGGGLLARALEEGGLPEDPLPLLLSDLNAIAEEHVLVFDDLHRLPPNSPLAGLLGRLVASAGRRTHFFLSSRTALPFPTARLKVTQAALEITELDLRFTREEAVALLTALTGQPPPADALDRALQLTEGWPAALVLLATAAVRVGGLSVIPAVDDLATPLPRDLCAYLADEVVGGLEPRLRSFMEESAILDVVTPAACEAILGRQDAEQILDQLTRTCRLLLVVGPGAYRYHPLLQRFLLGNQRARGAEVLNRLSRKCLVPGWLTDPEPGRLSRVVAQLPPSQKAEYPWMALCEARYLLSTGQAERALGMGRLALHAFEEAGDRRGAFYAHLLLSDCLFLRYDFAGSRAELARAAEALLPEFRDDAALLALKRAQLAYASGADPEDVEAQLRRALALYVESGDLIGEAEVSDRLGFVRIRKGDYRSGLGLLERSNRMLRSAGVPEHETGMNLAWAYLEVGRFRDSARLSRPLATSSRKAVRRAYAHVCLLNAHTRLGEFAEAAALAPAANALVEELNLPHLRTWLTASLAALYRLAGQAPVAAPFVGEALQMARSGNPEHAHLPARLEAAMLHLFSTGNAHAAAEIAQNTLETLESRATVRERVLLALTLAVARFRTSRTESRPEAVQTLQRALAECQLRGADFVVLHEWHLALAVIIYGLAYDVQAAYCLHLLKYMAEGLPPAIRQAGIALGGSELRALPAAWQALPDDASRKLLASLLTPEQRQRVAVLASGPAPLTIRVLGPLSVQVGSTPVDVRALKRRRSGQLLVLLLAHDGPVPREQIIERLWPDLSPRAADTSLRVALHHLRRLLEPHLGGRVRSRYIQAEDGLIWFNREPEVWVDLDQLRSVLQQADAARAAGRPEEAARLLEEASRLYKGDLLADDPYVLTDLRDFWRERCTEALDWLGYYYWLNAGSPEKAIHTFQRRLAIEEYHEPTHQALMRIYLSAGQTERVRHQYKVCEAALAVHLGVKPSGVTDSLLRLAVALEEDR